MIYQDFIRGALDQQTHNFLSLKWNVGAQLPSSCSMTYLLIRENVLQCNLLKSLQTRTAILIL